MDDACGALARLDVNALEQLLRRAETLQQVPLQPLAGRRARLLPLLKRLRLLYVLLKATEDNLAILRRAEAVEANERLAAMTGNHAGFDRYAPPPGLFASFCLSRETAGVRSASLERAGSWLAGEPPRPT